MSILAWHFVPANMKTYYGGLAVYPGAKHHVDTPIQLCSRGLHASTRIIDALSFQLGPVVCRVRLFGEVTRGPDKIVATDREVIWCIDATEALQWFAIDCRERQISHRLGVASPSIVVVESTTAARGYLMGSVSLDELRAKQNAASAASDAARAARAASDAASAASDAASAARAAARAAASAASAGERKWQSARLRSLIGKSRRGLKPWQ